MTIVDVKVLLHHNGVCIRPWAETLGQRVGLDRHRKTHWVSLLHIIRSKVNPGTLDICHCVLCCTIS